MRVLPVLVSVMLGGMVMGDEKAVTITVRTKGTELKLREGQVLELRLETTAGTGYTWVVAKNDKDILKQLGDPKTERPKEEKPGATALLVFRFQAVSPGVSGLELQYKRPFEKDKEPARTYALTVEVEKEEKVEKKCPLP